MANKVKTTQKITIEVGDQKMVLSSDEAREVLAHLSEVFKVEVKVIKDEKPVYIPYYRQWPYYVPTPAPTYPHIWYSTTNKTMLMNNSDASSGITIKFDPNTNLTDSIVKTTVE